MKYMMFVCTDTEPETDESQIPDIEAWVAENDANAPESFPTGVRAPATITDPAMAAPPCPPYG